jgi:hypothetical protein
VIRLEALQKNDPAIDQHQILYQLEACDASTAVRLALSRFGPLPRQRHLRVAKDPDRFDLQLRQSFPLLLGQVPRVNVKANHRIAKTERDGSALDSLEQIAKIVADSIRHFPQPCRSMTTGCRA